MKNINQEELLKLKNKIRLNYSSVKSIYCPALDSRVIFNSDGFHLYKNIDRLYVQWAKKIDMA